jgi:hypothetical protein
MGVDDAIFHLLLLTSWAADIRAAHRYYAAWSLKRRANLGLLLQLNGFAWLLCLFMVVLFVLIMLDDNNYTRCCLFALCKQCSLTSP